MFSKKSQLQNVGTTKACFLKIKFFFALQPDLPSKFLFEVIDGLTDPARTLFEEFNLFKMRDLMRDSLE